MKPSARWCSLSLVIVGVGFAWTVAAAQDPVADARAALGGERLLASVRSFRMAGQKLLRNQRLAAGERAGEEYVSSPMEIKAEFPARYLQSLDLVFGSASRRFESGFNGPRLLNKTVGGQSAGASSPDALVTQQTEFARLALLVFLRTDTALPLTRWRVAGRDVVWTTPNGDEILLSFEPTSRLPLRVTYQVAMRNRDGTRSDERRETTLEIRDRRVVEGLKLPSRIVLMRGGEIIEDMKFDTIEINAAFPVQTFGGSAGSPLGRE